MVAAVVDPEVDEEGDEDDVSEPDEDTAAAPAKAPATGKAKAQPRAASKKVVGSSAAGVGEKSHAAAAEFTRCDPLKAAEGMWKVRADRPCLPSRSSLTRRMRVPLPHQSGEPVPFLLLARTFEACSATTKRLEKDVLLTNALRSIIATTPDDLLPAVYLASCAIAPAYQNMKLGVGEQTVVKALAEATGRSEASVKELHDKEGDLGVVAQQCRSTQRIMFQPAPLTIRGVFAALRDIARTEGDKANEKKRAGIKRLLVAAREVEAGYLVRLLLGDLRVGLQLQTVIASVAHAALMQEDATAASADAPVALRNAPLADRLSAADTLLKQVHSECPSWDLILPALLRDGVMQLPETCHFVPGVPIKPMLAKATRGLDEIFERFGDVEFTCEYKYDGERAQIHVLENGEVRVFSRNLEDNTQRFPDIVARFKAHLKPGVRSVVLDAEAVAFDRDTGKILPFQVLSTRSRKGGAAEDVKVQVCVYAFDCIFADGRTLLREPLVERRRLLYSCLTETEGELQFAKQHTSRDLEQLREFLDESIAANTEGLIVKTMDATYEPSKRSLNWLKLKKDYLEGEGGGDSLDLVVIGAYFGKGKRTGVYGAFLLACYDEESEQYQSCCKVGTGFSEQDLIDFHAALSPLVVSAAPKYYQVGEGPTVAPDVWFTPSLVWEIKAADLSISPVHKAAVGLVDTSKGIALRFPRMLRVREDKKPEDATSAAQVAEFYRNQKINHKVEEEDADD